MVCLLSQFIISFGQARRVLSRGSVSSISHPSSVPQPCAARVAPGRAISSPIIVYSSGSSPARLKIQFEYRCCRVSSPASMGCLHFAAPASTSSANVIRRAVSSAASTRVSPSATSRANSMPTTVTPITSKKRFPTPTTRLALPAIFFIIPRAPLFCATFVARHSAGLSRLGRVPTFPVGRTRVPRN